MRSLASLTVRPVSVVFFALLALTVLSATVGAEEVTFTFTPAAEVQSVSLRGSMNDWGETPMAKGDDGIWRVTLDVAPDEHLYKYFVDGQWPSDMSTGLEGGPMDPDADGYEDDGYGGKNAVRRIGGAAPVVTPHPEVSAILEEGRARIHYHRPDGNYAGWGLHVWEETTEQGITWTSPLAPKGRDGYGLFWDVGLRAGAQKIAFIVHKGDQKDPGPDMVLMLEELGREVWLVSGREQLFTARPDVENMASGDLIKSLAYWLDRSTLAWALPVGEGDVVHLHARPGGGLELTPEGVQGGASFVLTRRPAGLSPELRTQYPHLAGLTAFETDLEPELIGKILKGQIAVSVTGADGRLRDATGVQIAGVLDDLFATDRPLGVVWDGDKGSLHLWAPTAQSVSLLLYDGTKANAPPLRSDMTEDRGVWSAAALGDRMFYLYDVEVYVPSTGRIEHNLVTDPYSRSLSMNSRRSQIVRMDDPALMPDDWAALAKPVLEAPEDITLYELHVRDFSASDPEVPENLRGTFAAFTLDSPGTRHLRSLAQAGLTHVHLLPAFDIATVNEDRGQWPDPGDLGQFPADSQEQQAAASSIRGEDGYNWGYDPFHYGVPEGSYSTDPDGPARVLEFRQMVQALSDMGLRTVMDVVYNHTNASGQSEKSVLDRIVPGYYHRLNADGAVETSTCCQNTATEHAMMERLMIDDLVHWARDYKVDGFRFDLMGHHMKRNMVAAREALDALTLEKDGVDGTKIYLYGEGWDFGEVAQGKRGVNATQPNMAGTGIGTFNDRIRDAIRGGNPFNDRREQGFATGLFTDPSGFNGSGSAERTRLLETMDRIRVGMAGNLTGYVFTGRNGTRLRGGELNYGGYTADPQEVINYASAHDNETLFDKIQIAAPAGATRADRIAMQRVALSAVALGQGIPFFHAGSEMLRSKGMDADSYDSGDWFNRLDFTYATNNFGRGLPPAEKNRDRWSMMGPLLAREDLRPVREEIRATVEYFEALLRVRRSSPLFRLRTAEDIQQRLRFLNTGPDQIPGLIVMEIVDEGGDRADLDPRHQKILVAINAAPERREFRHQGLLGAGYQPHPDLGPEGPGGFDPAAGTLVVPARSTLVLVAP